MQTDCEIGDKLYEDILAGYSVCSGKLARLESVGLLFECASFGRNASGRLPESTARYSSIPVDRPALHQWFVHRVALQKWQSGSCRISVFATVETEYCHTGGTDRWRLVGFDRSWQIAWIHHRCQRSVPGIISRRYSTAVAVVWQLTATVDYCWIPQS